MENEKNKTSQSCNIDSVMSRYDSLKIEYNECKVGFMKTSSNIYLSRMKEIESIFDFFNGNDS